MVKDRFVHYVTGYKEIDDEHFAMLLVMDEAILLLREKPPCPIKLKEVLTRIQTALLAHLIHEEALMTAANYKYTVAHTVAHDDLRIRMRNLLETTDFGHINVAEILKELEFILVAHIDGYDMQIKLWSLCKLL